MPVVTRWGTWLSAAEYYAQNLGAFESVVMQFDPEDACSIAHAQNTLKSPKLATNLAYISAHFGGLPNILKQLESRGEPIEVAVNRMMNLRVHFALSTGETAEKALKKYDSVLERNPGWKAIREIADIIAGTEGMNRILFLLHFLRTTSHIPGFSP